MDMKKIFNKETATKLLPILIAGTIAIIQEVNEQKESRKIDNMEKRISDLENKKES